MDDMRQFDWSTNYRNLYVPGYSASGSFPHHPRLSRISKCDQFRCVKILASSNPEVLPRMIVPAPNEIDFQIYQMIEEEYKQEKADYAAWVKELWAEMHFGKALAIHPYVKVVYDTYFKMRLNELSSYPIDDDVFETISIKLTTNRSCMRLRSIIKSVDIGALPTIECPDLSERFNIMEYHKVPRPSPDKLMKFQLPNDESIKTMPYPDVLMHLAKFAHENAKINYVASENALKCLVESNRSWNLCIAVMSSAKCDTCDGKNVVVLGSEFSMRPEEPIQKTQQASRHMLLQSLLANSNTNEYREQVEDRRRRDDSADVEFDSSSVEYVPPSPNDADEEMPTLYRRLPADFPPFLPVNRQINTPPNREQEDVNRRENIEEISSESSSEEFDNSSVEYVPQSLNDADEEMPTLHSRLPTDFPPFLPVNRQINTPPNTEQEDGSRRERREEYNTESWTDDEDTLFKNPPPRSFKEWEFINETGDVFNLLVHCPHKARDENGEVLVEPIIEHQLAFGGCAQSPEKIRSLALSLYLRENASLLTARIDAATGDVVTIDTISKDVFLENNYNAIGEVANLIQETFKALSGLTPGYYIMTHAQKDGPEVALYQVDNSVLANAESAAIYPLHAEIERAQINPMSVVPTICDVFLPYHKYNRVLPCTFTTEENELNDTARTALLRERLAACRNFGAGARTMEFPRNVSIRQVRPTFPRGPPRGRFSRMRASKRFPSSGYYRPAYGLRQPRAPPPFTARPRMQPPGSRDFQNPRYRQPYHSQDQYRWVNPNVQEQYRPRHPHHWSNRSQNPHNRKGPRKE